jgi:hypothetical protein
MVIDNPVTNEPVEIMTAPNFWYTQAAVNRCFSEWKQYRHRTLVESNVEASQFADFRIALNSVAGETNIRAINAAREELALEEWSLSTVEDDAGTAKTFTIMGDHTATKYAAMKGWLQTRPVPAPFSEPVQADLNSDGTLDYQVDFLVNASGTNDNITDQVIDVVEENDERPYPLLNIYGPTVDEALNLQSQSFVYVSANNPHQMIPGFKALCGLLQVNAGSGTTGALLYLDVHNSPEGF